ncbi:MAG: SIS domain-containing protein [Candidatus Microgenomates bacterium]|jgi:glucose/mannose-6-phosphate isomerase
MTDTLGIEEALNLFPDQLREAWSQAASFELPKITSKKIIISGMGGSSLAGRIISSLYEREGDIEISVFNDYGMPSYIDSSWTLIANSYSGSTEETLSAINVAKEKGIKIYGVSTGGKIGEMIKSGEIYGVVLIPTTNPSNYPKSALGVSLGGLLGLMSKLGVINLSAEKFEKSVNELIEIRKNWDVKSEASKMSQKIPALIAARPLLGSLHAGRNVINEIGRTFATFFDLPELDHHLVEATMFPRNLYKDIYYLFFISDLYPERIKTRIKISEDLFTEQKLNFGEMKLSGSNFLTQALEIPHFCAWLAFRLSELNGLDPGPEPWIIKLKESLS